MSALTLEEVKAYCRITDSTEDQIVQSLMDSAEKYLENAGVPEAAANTALYDLAVMALVLHWYDNRGNTAEGQVEIPLGLGALIIQLQNYTPSAQVSKLDTRQ